MADSKQGSLAKYGFTFNMVFLIPQNQCYLGTSCSRDRTKLPKSMTSNQPVIRTLLEELYFCTMKVF